MSKTNITLAPIAPASRKTILEELYSIRQLEESLDYDVVVQLMKDYLRYRGVQFKEWPAVLHMLEQVVQIVVEGDNADDPPKVLARKIHEELAANDQYTEARVNMNAGVSVADSWASSIAPAHVMRRQSLFEDNCIVYLKLESIR